MSKRVYSVLAVSMLLLTVWACKKDDKKNEDTPKPVEANKAPTCVVKQRPSVYVAIGTDTTLTIEVEAHDSDGHIAKVELFVGADKIGERSITPYSFTHNFLVNGTKRYAVSAIATDNLGVITKSDTISFFVDKLD
jgi:hypothetical protein